MLLNPPPPGPKPNLYLPYLTGPRHILPEAGWMPNWVDLCRSVPELPGRLALWIVPEGKAKPARPANLLGVYGRHAARCMLCAVAQGCVLIPPCSCLAVWQSDRGGGRWMGYYLG